MPLSLLSPGVMVPSAIALSASAFLLVGQPPLFLATGTGALAAWGLAFRGVIANERNAGS